MKEWLVANWPVLVCAVIYVVLQTATVSVRWKAILESVVTALERNPAVATSVAKSDIRSAGFKGNPEIDAILDRIQPKAVARVSKGKKVARFLLKLLPVVSLFV